MIIAINTLLAIAIWLELKVNFIVKDDKKITIHILPIVIIILFNLLLLTKLS